MKQYFFSLTFVVILSWPIAGQAQAQFARNMTKLSKTITKPTVAAAACIGGRCLQRQMDEIRRQSQSVIFSSTSHLQSGLLVSTAVTNPSKVTAFNPTKHPVTVPVMPSLRRDTIPVRTPLDSTETLEKSRVEVLKAIEHVANGDTDTDAYKEWLTRGAATGDPYCQSALKILKENGMIEGHDR